MAFYLVLHSPTKFIGYHDVVGLTKPAHSEICKRIGNNKTGVRPVIFNQCRDSGQDLAYAVYNCDDFVLFGIYLNVTRLAKIGLIDEDFSYTIRKDEKTVLEAFVGVVYIRDTDCGFDDSEQIEVNKDFFLKRYNEVMSQYWQTEGEHLQQRIVKIKTVPRTGNYQYISDGNKCINKARLLNVLKKTETKKSFSVPQKFEEAVFDTITNMAIKGEFDEEFLFISGKWEHPEKYLILKNNNDLKVIFGARKKKQFPSPSFLVKNRD
jgi:hypothetical protein